LSDLFEPTNHQIKFFLFFAILPCLHLKFMRRKEKWIPSIHLEINVPATIARNANDKAEVYEEKKSILLFFVQHREPTSSISFYFLHATRWMNGILQDLNYTFKVIVVCVLNCKIPSISFSTTTVAVRHCYDGNFPSFFFLSDFNSTKEGENFKFIILWVGNSTVGAFSQLFAFAITTRL
jgi:hypothetical protein